MPVRHIALAVLVAAVYGVAFVFIKLSVAEIPPLMATGYRYLFAAFPLVLFVGKPDVSAGWLIVYGIMQAVVMFGLIFTAIAWGIPGGLASVLAQVQVFFTIAFSALLFGERPGPVQIAGATIALAGIAVIGVARAEAAPALPFLMVIGSAAAWGAANVIAKKAAPQKMLHFVVWSALAAPLPLFALSTLIEGTSFGLPPAPPSPAAIVSVLFLAWPTTVFAFTAWVWLLRRYPAAVVTPFALLIPVFGIGSTALAFGETLSPMIWAGTTLVFAGLAVNVFAPRLFPKA